MWPDRDAIRACNRLARTNVTNQSAKRLQITVDSCEKSSKMSTTTHVEIRSRKIVMALLLDYRRSGVD